MIQHDGNRIPGCDEVDGVLQRLRFDIEVDRLVEGFADPLLGLALLPQVGLRPFLASFGQGPPDLGVGPFDRRFVREWNVRQLDEVQRFEQPIFPQTPQPVGFVQLAARFGGNMACVAGPLPGLRLIASRATASACS